MENILELEKSLFKYDYMSNKEYLNNIIADNYEELGKSGILFNKDDVVNYLLSQQRDRDIEMYNFSGEELKPDLWIVHYITLSDNKKIYRTSIWKHNKIIFHQASIYNEEIELIRS